MTMFKMVNGVVVEMTPEEEAAFLAAQSKPPFRICHVAWFKAALAKAGKLTAVNTAVAGLPQDKQVLWEYATNVNSEDADVKAIAAALNIDLQAMFDSAETIRRERTGEA